MILSLSKVQKLRFKEQQQPVSCMLLRFSIASESLLHYLHWCSTSGGRYHVTALYSNSSITLSFPINNKHNLDFSVPRVLALFNKESSVAFVPIFEGHGLLCCAILTLCSSFAVCFVLGKFIELRLLREDMPWCRLHRY